MKVVFGRNSRSYDCMSSWVIGHSSSAEGMLTSTVMPWSSDSLHMGKRNFSGTGKIVGLSSLRDVLFTRTML